MNNLKIAALASALTLGSISANAGSITQEVTFNLKTVTALSFSGDFAFNMDDLVGGDTILSTESITLNYDNGDGSTPTAGGTRTVSCTVSVDDGSSYANADADSGGSLQTVTLTSNNGDVQTLNLDFNSNCGDGSATSQINTITVTGTMNSEPDDNSTYSTASSDTVHIKAAYAAKSGISLNDDLGE
jgi:hypothetical protein